jgi:GT2 family glycosyltransferase
MARRWVKRPVASDVSVVIPTLGRELLEGCLASIAAGTAWPAEVIVVDQGSSSSVASWIDRLTRPGLGITHVRSSETGIAAGTNRGLERVRTRFVATTHDDCRVQADWMERLSARTRDVGDSILTGRVEPRGEGVVLTVITRREPTVYSEPLIDRDVLFPPNMAFPIRLLERIGYFDEHPSLRLAGEDNEWAYRALRRGIPIVYDPDIVVDHIAWQDPHQRISLLRRYARGQGSFYGKHLRRGDAFILRRTIRDLVRAPWLVLRGAATGNRDLLAMGVGAVTGLPVGLLAGLRNAGDHELWGSVRSRRGAPDQPIT